VEELKRAIITEWQRFTDSRINEWRRRLECVVKNGGGHIENCNSLELKLDLFIDNGIY